MSADATPWAPVGGGVRALAHVVPIRHDAQAEPAITLALLALGVLGAILAGVLLARALPPRVREQQAARALALGMLLFLFFDLVKETASLGQGVVQRPLLQVGLVGSFAAGAVGLAVLGGGAPSPRLAWAWALGIAAHGMAEGWIVGTEAHSTAFAEPLQASSFLLHKLAEGFTVFLVAATRPTPRAALGVAAALGGFALLGGLGGLLLAWPAAPLVLFALGAGAAAYAILLLARRVPPTTPHAAWIALGVALIYAAGLLHQI